MENHEIMIHSDGQTTELYIDGEKIKDVTELYFSAEPHHAYLDYEKYTKDKDGFMVSGKYELEKEKHHLKRGERVVKWQTNIGQI